MTKNNWHDGSASVILLPGGEVGADLVTLVAHWTKSWMLKPAFWIHEADIVESEDGPPRIFASITGRNGSERVDLFPQLSRLDIKNIRVIAARVVGHDQKTDRAQDDAVSLLEKYIEQSRPIRTRNIAEDIGIKILKVNLIFAPTEQKGASFTDLLESHWDINLVVAPEDRATPTSFDGFTRYADKAKMNGFILSNIASTAGIWSGQQKSIFELSNQFSDLSPVQNQVRVMRTFVRGILSEGLAVEVAVEALKLAGNASSSTLTGRIIPNPHLVAFEENQVKEKIDEMLESALNFENGALRYKPVPLTFESSQVETGVVSAIKFFFRSSWSLIKILPLWIFTAFWNFLARAVTARLFGARGREVAKGTIDFPKTDLDKDSARNLVEIAERREKIKKTLEQWPKNSLRKSEPGLWGNLRKLVIGRLDGSSLPENLSHNKKDDGLGYKVFGDLNKIIPSTNDEWILPENISRTLDSEPRKVNWREIDAVENIDDFLKMRINQAELVTNELNSKIQALLDDVVVLDQANKQEVEKLEKFRLDTKLENLVGNTHV